MNTVLVLWCMMSTIPFNVQPVEVLKSLIKLVFPKSMIVFGPKTRYFDLSSWSSEKGLGPTLIQLDGTPSRNTGKIICQWTGRATKNPRSPLESSRQVEPRSMYLVQFCVINFDLFFQNNFQNNVQKSSNQVDSDSHWILVCQGLRSFWGALVCWRIDFLVS